MQPEDLSRPYAGSTPLFKIGLFPFPPSEWIEIDDQLERYLAEKDRLLTKCPELVFVEETDTSAAQKEVLELVLCHLVKHFPETYEVLGNRVSIPSLKRQVNLDGPEATDLVNAARLIQDDLVLMRRDSSGWRLVAGCVCFPSSWDLTEKFGKPLQIVHEPVPEFGPGSRNAAVIERIFDNLKVGDPVKRLNWSIYSDDALFHNLRSEVHRKREKADISLDNGFLRMETQTLTKLPKTGDVLFTIRIHIEPMAELKGYSDGVAVREGFARLLELLDTDQLAYKGLTNLRDKLVAELKEFVVREKKSVP